MVTRSDRRRSRNCKTLQKTCFCRQDRRSMWQEGAVRHHWERPQLREDHPGRLRMCVPACAKRQREGDGEVPTRAQQECGRMHSACLADVCYSTCSTQTCRVWLLLCPWRCVGRQENSQPKNYYRLLTIPFSVEGSQPSGSTGIYILS